MVHTIALVKLKKITLTCTLSLENTDDEICHRKKQGQVYNWLKEQNKKMPPFTKLDPKTAYSQAI